MELLKIQLVNEKNYIQGLKLRPIQSHLRLNFFPLRLKYPLLFRNKKVTSYQFVATLIKIINKERNNKIVLFLAMNFLSI